MLDSKYELHDISAPPSQRRQSLGSGGESGCSLLYGDSKDRSVEERALVWKIDLHIIPLVCIIDFLQFLDKSAINYAALMGLKEDIGLTPNQYDVIASLFYLGYFCYQIPNNYCLQYVRIGRYMGILLIVWGSILAATAACKTYSQLAAMRFLLGFAEAGIYPSLILLISTMYRRAEQTWRLGIFWLCNGFALAIGGLIGYGAGHLNGGGLHAWQWFMIILGGVTVLVGIFTYFFLIDDPRSLRWHHNAEEQIMVDERIRDNAVVRTSHVKYDQIWEALKESRFWCFCLISFLANMQNGALTNYSAQITESFGYQDLDAILLQIPTGVADIIYICVAAWVTTKTGQTIYVGCACLIGTGTGLLLLEFIPLQKAKLAGLYLCWGYAAAYVMLVATTTANVSGYTKKIFYNGMSMIFYTIGNFVGPFLMNMTEDGAPVNGLLGYVIADFLAVALFLFTRWQMHQINEKRLREPSVSCNEEDDITDAQDPNFIYRL
ncbi:major facilitator superfamily domain-containing protein [Radiomyces spectabilis]|uniref:major facilitator superfamily domain-containing protein n=1 Tax=Radiomyces spectabilis TaxID=64574 RepID=UPI00221E4625|nr:major facilitator superfamily domain-containing protein [Radiomyces spectabilis]KAI8377435.1 major facilitator superfamily domain-containing protein [Radiomyces spectabilis]